MPSPVNNHINHIFKLTIPLFVCKINKIEVNQQTRKQARIGI